MMKLKLILLSFFVSFSVTVVAFDYIWTGADFAVNNNWDNEENWLRVANNGSTSVNGFPDNNDRAFFNNTSFIDCSINVSITVISISVSVDYTGQITQNTGAAINISQSGSNQPYLTIQNGSFVGSNAAITVQGNILISGSTTNFTSTTSNLIAMANFELSGGATFNHNSGTVQFTASNTITGNIDFHNLIFNPSAAATHNILNTLTTNNELRYNGTVNITLNTGTINAKGDIYLSNTATGGGGSATINVSSLDSPQTIYGASVNHQSNLPNVSINKVAQTINFQNIISIKGNFNLISGIINAGSSTVNFNGTQTVALSSPEAFNNVVFSGAGTTLVSDIDINGNVELLSGGVLNVDSYTVFAAKDVSISGTLNSGTGTFVFDGSADQNILGTVSPTFYDAQINKSSGKVILNNSIGISHELAFTGGIIETGTNQVNILDNATTSGASDTGFVDGNVAKAGDDAFTFPVGDNSVYSPVAMSTPTTSSTFLVSYTDAAHPNASDPVQQALREICDQYFWSINRTSGTGEISLALNWSAFISCLGTNEELYAIAAYNTTSNTWNNIGNNLDLTGQTVSSNNQNAFPFDFTTALLKGIIVNSVAVNETTYSITAPGYTSSTLTSGQVDSEVAFVPNPFPNAGEFGEALIDISAGTSNNALQVKVIYDETITIQKAQANLDGQWRDMEPTTYNIEDGNKIIFSNTPQQANNFFELNLSNGIEYDNTSDLILTVNIPNIDLTGSQWRITGPISTIVPPTGNQFLWNGTSASAGLYKFELEIQSNIYHGQFIIK